MGVFLLVPRDVALGYELEHAAHRRRVRTDANHSSLFTVTGSLPGVRGRVCRLGDSSAVTASTYGRAPGHAAHCRRALAELNPRKYRVFDRKLAGQRGGPTAPAADLGVPLRKCARA